MRTSCANLGPGNLDGSQYVSRVARVATRTKRTRNGKSVVKTNVDTRKTTVELKTMIISEILINNLLIFDIC